jgi:hypothetical protein
MKQIIRICFISILIGLFISCGDTSTNIVKSMQTKFYQVTGCKNKAISKIVKNIESDTCFLYTFTDTLKIDFCIYGCCWPDSGRFDINYSIEGDTIHVSAKDTARGLTNCICPYKIHTEFMNLPNDHYIFIGDDASGLDPIYIENVYKNGKL